MLLKPRQASIGLTTLETAHTQGLCSEETEAVMRVFDEGGRWHGIEVRLQRKLTVEASSSNHLRWNAFS